MEELNIKISQVSMSKISFKFYSWDGIFPLVMCLLKADVDGPTLNRYLRARNICSAAGN